VATNEQIRRILLATAMTSLQVGVLLAANPGLRSTEPPTQREVNVYLENIPDVFWNAEGAKAITAQIFSSHVNMARRSDSEGCDAVGGGMTPVRNLRTTFSHNSGCAPGGFAESAGARLMPPVRSRSL
jgi:hypothetical protein